MAAPEPRDPRPDSEPRPTRPSEDWEGEAAEDFRRRAAEVEALSGFYGEIKGVKAAAEERAPRRRRRARRPEAVDRDDRDQRD